MSKSLVIVESPAKARTLQKYLGKAYEVKASVGHIRDLPTKTLGVDVENDFTPQYVTIRGKAAIIKDLQRAAKKAEKIYLAPDPDREGEAIAWHIAESLKSQNKPFLRALFHELTPKAIRAALEAAADLDQNKFEAQQARRILDRLVGYQISPLLWDKVRRGLSAGRVQSVAVRMICEREAAIEAFVSEEYWTIVAQLKAGTPPPFPAQVESIQGKKIKPNNEAAAQEIVTALRQASFVVAGIEKKEKKRYPSPPFITSTLQQDANRKLRFSAKKTMSLAQRLYEGIELGAEGPVGLITYMRTDSTRINQEALTEVRSLIKNLYGANYLPAKATIFKTKKSAQDAHEAIRPTNVALTPDKLAPHLDRDLLALYTLIWKRFVACQMQPAIYDQTTIFTDAGLYRLKTVGSTMRFPGFTALYVEADDTQASSSSKEDQSSGAEDKIELPALAVGDLLELMALQPKQHFTQPPSRYNEATLVKALEENGVGRPSTYASIISTILDKEYVILLQRSFSPTQLGRMVNDLLVLHFPTILNIEFTASMEKNLDRIEEGQTKWLQVLRQFYGPFAETLVQAKQQMKSIKMESAPTDIVCQLCGGAMVIRWGRNGEFLACAHYPDCKNSQNFKRGEKGEIIPLEKDKLEESEEKCEKCGRSMVFRNGRFGKFLACSGYPDCKYIRALGTGVTCPEPGCGGELVQKVSRKGKIFYGCNNYPKCSFASWDKPIARPCPQCQSPYLLEKVSKKSGVELKCANPSCDYTEEA